MTNTTFDPTTTATSLAAAYTSAAQALLTAQGKTATATSSALNKLQSALSAFDSALSSLSGKSSLSQNSATLTGGSAATASATSKAAAGTYSFFVEQLATNQQIAFSDLPATEAGATGKLTLSLANGDSFDVEMSTADSDGNGSLSYAEIARAINQAPENKGKISAQIMTVGGKTQLMFASGVSGEDGEISISADGTVDPALAAILNAPPDELLKAKDAIVWLGAQGTGVQIKQGSNTITAIDGVTLTLTAAQANGSAPMSLTVGRDASGTSGNVQSFVDAYNALRTTLDGMINPGGEGSNANTGAFANDSSVRSLRDRLGTMLRQDFGGTTLRDLGVTADRYGKLSLNADKLKATLVAKPEALDTVFGKASLTTSSGLLGSFSKAVDEWTDGSRGLIKRRQDVIQDQQSSFVTRQAKLDGRYNVMYARYLKQFSALQAMQESMAQTTNLLDALFSSPSKS